MKNIDYLEAMEIGQNPHFIGVNDKYNKNNISTVKMEIAELLENGEISVESLKKLVPPNVPNTFIPTKTISRGYKYSFISNGINLEIKWHSIDINAFKKYPGCNSGLGWTAKIKVNRKLLTSDGTFVKKAKNETHIPIMRGD